MPRPRKSPTRADTVITRLRIERGISQQEMADAIGISIRTYRAIEGGITSNPKLRDLLCIAMLLGIDPKKDLSRVLNDEFFRWLPDLKPFKPKRRRFKQHHPGPDTAS